MTLIGLFLLAISAGAFHSGVGARDFILAWVFLAIGVYVLTLRGKRF